LPVLGLPTSVWLLEIRFRHGTHRSVHLTDREARAALAEFVRGQWGSEINHTVWSGQPPAVPADPPQDDDDAIELYYTVTRPRDEDYLIDEVDLAGAADTAVLQSIAGLGDAFLRTLDPAPTTTGATGAAGYVVETPTAGVAVTVTPDGTLDVHIDAHGHDPGRVHVHVHRATAEGTTTQQWDHLVLSAPSRAGSGHRVLRHRVRRCGGRPLTGRGQVGRVVRACDGSAAPPRHRSGRAPAERPQLLPGPSCLLGAVPGVVPRLVLAGDDGLGLGQRLSRPLGRLGHDLIRL
jgi:hypothetical protein